MLIQNRIYTATITDYTIQGQGIAHVEGCAVFIPNAIAGEVCEIQITKAAKTWAAGRIRRILEVSPHRVNRACPQSKLCGGCAFQHMDYQEECRLKAERVRQALNRLGGEALKTMDLLPAPETRPLSEQGPVPGGPRRNNGPWRASTGRGPIRWCPAPSAASWPRKWMLSGMRWWII